jgi:hypothetical protein
MPKYRLKSEDEMAWNAIRRAATAKFRLEAAAWLEKRLIVSLPGLQVEFQKALQSGNLPELEAEFETWVADAMEASQTRELTGASQAG